MVLQNVAASGRFGGSRLQLDAFTGATRRGGTVAGRGSFDLAAAGGFGMDLAIDARNAQLLDRDDIKAQVTGPIRIRSGPGGGTISGQVTLDSGSFSTLTRSLE